MPGGLGDELNENLEQINMAPRNFYEDEKSVIPLPGTSITATPDEIEALGPNQIINGSSVRSPFLIQSKIEHLRQKVNSFYTFSNEKIDEATQAYNTKEQHFTSTISSLHNKNEDLLANGQYILVAGLSGLILTRRSNVLFKAVAPVALALLAFKFALPKTWSNTIGFAHDLEKEKFPALVVKQDSLVKTANDIISSTESKTNNAQKEVESKLSEAKGAFKKFTGLRIDEDATKK